MWEIVYRGNLIAIEKHTEKGYERAVRPPGVRLLLKNLEGAILLTKEYRAEQGGFDYRLPGGKVFDTLEQYLKIRGNQAALDSAVLSAASIEAKEEAGVDEIENLRIFHDSHAGASVEWDLYYVSGKVLSMSEQNLGGDELHHGIEVAFYTAPEVLFMIKNGEIQEDRTVGVLCKYL